MDFIDLRSDTVTHPTPAMREAMAKAEVGDDVYGEDPTVNRLQEMAAALMRQEAGLFVASGTMGNLAAILAHCGRGDEAILGDKSHTFYFEAGGISALGGVPSYQLPNQPDGSLAIEDIQSALRDPSDPHYPFSRLVALENTHNRCGGTFQTPEYTRQLCDFAHAHGLVVHLDGARIFNAAVAQGIAAKELTAPVDSVTFCLSKGLCAPVGSVLCGSKAFIAKAHRIRKMLGGGMRQAGILAAAGIVALETMIERLVEDHARARKLADGLKQVAGLTVDAGSPATNMVFLSLADEVTLNGLQVEEKMKANGVLISAIRERRFRLVTHYWIDDAGVEKTVAAFRQVLH
ncbi:MAG: low-specificity L-threonine aldolase [Anaerolineales bacterium]|nr:low-specificity L-threonine aldolase [Anaerolineales bacterium]